METIIKIFALIGLISVFGIIYMYATFKYGFPNPPFSQVILRKIYLRYLDLRYKKDKEILITVDGRERLNSCSFFVQKLEYKDKRVLFDSYNLDSYFGGTENEYYCYKKDEQKVLKYLEKHQNVHIKDVNDISKSRKGYSLQRHIHIKIRPGRCATEYFKEKSAAKKQAA